MAVENLAPACRKKCQERKSNFRKAFYKNTAPKDPREAGAAGAASPDSRPPKEAQLSAPVCHWPLASVSSNSGEQTRGCHGNRGCLWPRGFLQGRVGLMCGVPFSLDFHAEQSRAVWGLKRRKELVDARITFTLSPHPS